MDYEEDYFKKRFQEILDSLDWFLLEECSKCKRKVKISILDGECPSCKEPAIQGKLYPNIYEIYQELFVDAIHGCMDEKMKMKRKRDYRPHFIRVYTSLETFLLRVAEEQMRKKHINSKVVSFIFDNMRPDVGLYFELLDSLDVKVEKKDKTFIEGLRKIQKIRNIVVHKAEYPSEEQVLEAFEKIAKVFSILCAYSIFTKKRKIGPAEWV
jgi:hypothetical protein